LNGGARREATSKYAESLPIGCHAWLFGSALVKLSTCKDFPGDIGTKVSRLPSASNQWQDFLVAALAAG